MNAATIKSELFKESIERMWPIWVAAKQNYTAPLIWWENYKLQN